MNEAKTTLNRYIKALLTRQRIAPELKQKLQSLTADEWQFFIDDIKAKGALGIVRGEFLRDETTNLLPASVYKNFSAQYHNETAKTAYILNEFEKLANFLSKRNIPIIALKGIYLSQAIYGNPSERPFCDMDILCKKEDLPKITALAPMLGYVLPPEKYGRWVMNCYYNTALFHARDVPFYVDIHWAISPPYGYNINIDDIWRRSKSWLDEHIRTLSPEDIVLHLALHAFGDYKNLRWLGWHTIAKTLETLPVKTDALIDLAKKYKIQGVLYLIFSKTFQETASESAQKLLTEIKCSPLQKFILEKWLALNENNAPFVSAKTRLGRELMSFVASDDVLLFFKGKAKKLWHFLLYGAEPTKEVLFFRNFWREKFQNFNTTP